MFVFKFINLHVKLWKQNEDSEKLIPLNHDNLHYQIIYVNVITQEIQW